MTEEETPVPLEEGCFTARPKEVYARYYDGTPGKAYAILAWLYDNGRQGRYVDENTYATPAGLIIDDSVVYSNRYVVLDPDQPTAALVYGVDSFNELYYKPVATEWRGHLG